MSSTQTSQNDGTILIKVSNIQSPTLRRLAIVGSFIPMVAITMLLITFSYLRATYKNIVGLFSSAKKFW